MKKIIMVLLILFFVAGLFSSSEAGEKKWGFRINGSSGSYGLAGDNGFYYFTKAHDMMMNTLNGSVSYFVNDRLTVYASAYKMLYFGAGCVVAKGKSWLLFPNPILYDFGYTTSWKDNLSVGADYFIAQNWLPIDIGVGAWYSEGRVYVTGYSSNMFIAPSKSMGYEFNFSKSFKLRHGISITPSYNYSFSIGAGQINPSASGASGSWSHSVGVSTAFPLLEDLNLTFGYYQSIDTAGKDGNKRYSMNSNSFSFGLNMYK